MIYQFQFPDDQYKKYDLFRYPAGEIQVRLNKAALEAVKNASEVHITATITDGEVMGLAQLVSAIRNTPSNIYRPIKLIMPYLPYARADREFTPGDCFGLRTFGAVIESLNLDQVVTLDVHSEVAKNEIRYLKNVSPKPLIEVALEDIAANYPLVQIILPDNGADRYGYIGAPKCSKHRDPVTGVLSGFTLPEDLDFKMPQHLIVDDICDGGGTFNGIAEEFEKAGYNGDLYLYVTHGIFSKGFTELKKHFKHIYTTDSFPKVPWYGYEEMVTRIPAGGVILDAITTRSELYGLIENWKSHPVKQTVTLHNHLGGEHISGCPACSESEKWLA